MLKQVLEVHELLDSAEANGRQVADLLRERGLEVAKAYTAGRCRFYDPGEYERLLALYGSMEHLQTPGRVTT